MTGQGDERGGRGGERFMTRAGGTCEGDGSGGTDERDGRGGAGLMTRTGEMCECDGSG